MECVCFGGGVAVKEATAAITAHAQPISRPQHHGGGVRTLHWNCRKVVSLRKSLVPVRVRRLFPRKSYQNSNFKIQ